MRGDGRAEEFDRVSMIEIGWYTHTPSPPLPAKTHARHVPVESRFRRRAVRCGCVAVLFPVRFALVGPCVASIATSVWRPRFRLQSIPIFHVPIDASGVLRRVRVDTWLPHLESWIPTCQ